MTLQADDLELYPLYIALAEGALSESDLAARLRQQITQNPDKHVHEKHAPYTR